MISDVKVEEIVRMFYAKEIQVEKVIKKKRQ